MNDTHSQNSQAPNSALSKQIGQVRCKAVLTIQHISPWGDQRAGKRSAARHGQHARPPFPPSEERGTGQQWGCGPSPHSCKVTREVGSLSAPSASGFDANDHQSAAVSALRTVTQPTLLPGTEEVRWQELRWPSHRLLALRRSCHGVWCCIGPTHPPHGKCGREFSLVRQPVCAACLILRTLPNVSPLCPVGTRTRKHHR